MKRITIIGGGASGTLVAVNLMREAGERRMEINLIEKRASIGRGVAYSTPDEIHLLNVPAAKMSAFPDEPEHFLQWLEREGLRYGPSAFVPRKTFGQYLASVFREAREAKRESVSLNIFEDDAVDVQVDAGKAVVALASGEHIYSESVILAFGNFPPPQPSLSDLSFTEHPKYFRSPWADDVFKSIRADDAVLIIGTGLSMVDVVLKLANDGHKGPISAISTRGLLPAVHELGKTYAHFTDELLPMSRITDILKAVRRHIAQAEKKGSGWRAVIDSLRPATQQIWLALPLSEKKYFMQHLSRYWNAARHRMPAEAAAVIERLQRDGQLKILKGRLQRISTNGRFATEYQCLGRVQAVESDVIVNCIGSESDFKKLDSRLLSSLFGRGYIRSDELNFGIDALPNGAVVGQNGVSSEMIFTLGTALKGTLWETTAIPEIRHQARGLAHLLLSA
jgi:uncharacterized NAD(P)/FAD-binding protein YdhS